MVEIILEEKGGEKEGNFLEQDSQEEGLEEEEQEELAEINDKVEARGPQLNPAQAAEFGEQLDKLTDELFEIVDPIDFLTEYIEGGYRSKVTILSKLAEIRKKTVENLAATSKLIELIHKVN